ncbi:MAG TPA: malectin domain-containing carbohydrate-binding protein [Candidatus Acidoferrum sp.]|nr:malectin domain-containing carbohydrate-binding protein [Candidatus Acidoferrum sp.]
MKKIVSLFAFLLMAGLPATAQTQEPIRVRCGGPTYTDSKGQVWQSDYGYNTGTSSTFSTTSPISGTPDPKLFQDERFVYESTSMTYSFPVANGTYHVNLYFAEIFSGVNAAGKRVFNVKIDGTLAFPNLDIFAASGPNAALVKGADVVVQNGVLSIEFDNVVQNAKVDAIEILPISAQAPQMTLNFTYPDGTPVPGTLGYAISSSSLNFQGSVPLTNGQATCYLLTSAASLGLGAQFAINLSLKDTAGHILWQLGLDLNPSQINLAAVLNGSVNVTVQHL